MNAVRNAVALAIVATLATAGLQSNAQASPEPPSPGPTANGRGVPAEVQAASPGASAEVLAVMKKQNVVSRTAMRIKEESAKLGRDSGLGGLVNDPKGLAMTVYWHGRVPAAVARQITEGRKSGVEISISRSAYSAEALKAHIARLMAYSLDHGDHVASAAPKADGSGLGIGMRSKDRAVAEGQARKLLQEVRIDVPYKIMTGASAVFTENQRNGDIPPFWAGGSFFGPVGRCTTGFGVTSLSDQQSYILTADHCGSGQFITPKGTIVGSTALSRPTIDVQLIRASSGTEMFIGDWWGGGLFSALTVSAVTANIVGDLICSSGASSGSICNVEVKEVDVTANIEGRTVIHLVRSEHRSDLAATGSGDSGGPVYVPNADGMHAHARGTVVATAGNRRPCFGDQDENRVCGSVMYYADIFEATAATGVVLKTA